MPRMTLKKAAKTLILKKLTPPTIKLTPKPFAPNPDRTAQYGTGKKLV